MIKKTNTITKLQDGVRSILAKSGYAFSEEDKAILEAILVELEEMSNEDKVDPNLTLNVISILLRFLKFCGIEDFSSLF